MSDDQPISTDISDCLDLMRDKLGIRGATLTEVAPRCKRVMPRHTHGALRTLAEAESRLDHPKLRQTVDTIHLSAAVHEVQAYLKAVDVADRRKGWWLGMLGGLAFNMLAFAALLIGILLWRGFI